MKEHPLEGSNFSDSVQHQKRHPGSSGNKVDGAPFVDEDELYTKLLNVLRESDECMPNSIDEVGMGIVPSLSSLNTANSFNGLSFMGEGFDTFDKGLDAFDKGMGLGLGFDKNNASLVSKMVPFLPFLPLIELPPDLVTPLPLFVKATREYLDQLQAQICTQSSMALSRQKAVVINRWRNVNVSLPITFAEGTVVSTTSMISQTSYKPDGANREALPYSVSFEKPTPLQLIADPQSLISLFSGFDDITLTAPQHLSTRLAVIHKCPDFFLPLVAQLIRICFEGYQADKPVALKCTQLARCSVSQRNHLTGQQWYERVEGLLEPATPEDAKTLQTLSDRLEIFSYCINTALKGMLTEWYHTMMSLKQTTTRLATPPGLGLGYHLGTNQMTSTQSSLGIPREMFDPIKGLAMEYRWAPSAQMKVNLGSRKVNGATRLEIIEVQSTGLEASQLTLIQERPEGRTDPRDNVRYPGIIRTRDNQPGLIHICASEHRKEMDVKVAKKQLNPNVEEFVPRNFSNECVNLCDGYSTMPREKL